MKKPTTLPNHFDSINDLTLYRWDKYTSTKDNNWFLVDYDGRQKKLSTEVLKEVEDSLIEQYFKAVADRSFSLKIQKWAKIDGLKTKYMVVDSLLNRMWLGFGNYLEQQTIRHSFITELKKWGFKFPELNTAESDKQLIIDYRKALEGIKTQIGIISNELQDDGKKETKDLYQQIAIAKSNLPGYEMNPRIMVVAEWIAIHKLLNEKAKQN